MKAEIIDRKWVVEWFDERQCYHMPSLTLADNGSLLAVWNGGFLQWNGDPHGPRRQGLGIGAGIRRLRVGQPGRGGQRHPLLLPRPGVFKEQKGRDHSAVRKVFGHRGELYYLVQRPRRALDPQKRTAAAPGSRQSRRAFRAAMPPTTACFCRTAPLCSLPPAARSRTNTSARCASTSHDDGESWEQGPLLAASDGSLIREPALCLRPDGTIRMFTRTCPGSTGWGAGVKSLVSYTAESRDGGRTWSQPRPTTIVNNESKIDVISWDENTILMAYNNTPVADWHERSPLTLACSEG